MHGAAEDGPGRRLAGRGSGRLGGGAEAAPDTDLLHNKLDIEIFTATSTITGTNVMTVQSKVADLTQFTFTLRSNYTITSATIGGTPVTVTSVGTYGRQVTLDRAYALDEIFDLTIAYTGVAVSRGFGSINFTSVGGNSLVFTLSEPYFAATWWPSKDGDFGLPGDNGDKATIELSVTAPNTLTTVSNGLLQGVDALSGGRSRYRWASNYQTSTYLVFFSTSKYNTWSQTYTYDGGTMPVEFAIFPADDNTTNRALWEKCITMLGTYKDIYGLYPFIDEKYGIYEFTFGGGQEHQTYTGEGTFSESVTSHELGHQWWGDNITCKYWNDIWLNESFADYTEALWEERKPGSTGLPALFAAMAARRPSAVSDTVYVYDVSDFNRIFDYNYTYLKGGWVLHMLRHVVGDSTFFDILANYRAMYQGGGATTDDFAGVASAVSGQDLTYFFNQWIYGGGAPAYQYGWQAATINGANYLRLYVKQTQTSGLFSMPIDIRRTTSGGATTTTVWNSAAAQWYLIPVSAAVTSIGFDENDWILDTAKTSIAYVAGPPKVVSAVPGPGAQLSTAPSAIVVGFSDDVTTSAADYTITGPSGNVPFTFSYAPTSFTTTLIPTGPLPNGDYFVTVNDSITRAGSSSALDGELADPNNSALLPSGDGLASGDAVFAFHVNSVKPGDTDNDGDVDLSDLGVVLAAYGACVGDSEYVPAADFDSSGCIDLSDLGVVLANYGT